MFCTSTSDCSMVIKLQCMCSSLGQPERGIAADGRYCQVQPCKAPKQVSPQIDTDEISWLEKIGDICDAHTYGSCK